MPKSPTTSPTAPASFTAPSAGNQERGTPTSAEFARTNLAGMRSATAIPAVMIAVVSVITTYAVFIWANPLSCGQSVVVQLFPLRRAEWPQGTARRTIDRVMVVLVSFATESSMDVVIFLTTPVQKR
jgi:hypothetical protein